MHALRALASSQFASAARRVRRAASSSSSSLVASSASPAAAPARRRRRASSSPRRRPSTSSSPSRRRLLVAAASFFATLAPGWSQQLLFGLGARLRVPAALNVVAFFGVGLPVGAALAYGGGLAERGIWMGLLLAMQLVVVGQYTYLMRTTNWEQAARRARERALAKDKKPDDANARAADESDGRGLAAADSAAAAVEM